LATDINQSAFHDGLLDMAMWRLSSMRSGKPLSSITLDVDGLPIETFGQQVRTGYNSYVGYSHYSPLVASIAETGDMVGGLLRGETAVVQYKLSTGFPSWLNGLARQPAPRSEFVLMRVLLATQHFRHWMTPILNMLVDCPAIPYLSAKRHTTSKKRPVGRPTHQLREWCHEFYYQAQSWEKPRRIILVVCEQPDDLF
jgi:hypothetical protein